MLFMRCSCEGFSQWTECGIKTEIQDNEIKMSQNKNYAVYNWLMAAIACIGLATGIAGGVAGIRATNRLKELEKAAHEAECETPASLAERDEKIRREIAAASDGRGAKLDENAFPASKTIRMEVEKVIYDGNDQLRLELSQRPDMDVVRQYVTVEPMNSGLVSFRYTTPLGHHPATNDYIPTLYVIGDFAHRTNVTLRIRKGFPVHGAAPSSADATGLAQDFEYTFQRKDRDPAVDFADIGRYLPATSEAALAFKCVNVDEIEVATHQLPSANIVQFLALEEDEYSKIYKSYAWRDSLREEFASDIAAEPVVRRASLRNEVNKEETAAVSLADAGRGVFLVRASIGGKKRDDDNCAGAGENQYRFRVVCISDLGLSVRDTCNGTFLVWLNSLTSGLPVEGAEIAVYSKANVLVAKGKTDADGLCRPDRVASGDAFAVVATARDGSDTTFLALRNSMEVDETYPEGWRDEYLADGQAAAFVWTERGIYRHGETIFMNALLRTGEGAAPAPQPVEVLFAKPDGDIYSRKTLVTDEKGSVTTEEFSAPADQPSGEWKFIVRTPGKGGRMLGDRVVKIEEFAPPQIRVQVEEPKAQLPEFEFAVTAEHLYGGAAKGLVCEGAVVFDDVPFAPAGWEGYRFGNDDRGLKPSFRRLKKSKLDDAGRHVFQAPIWESSGLPKAAVRATGQATVFEDGGRPASNRRSVICHYYPFYIGTTLTGWLAKPAIGLPAVEVACVTPDGRRVAGTKRLEAKIERIDTFYSYRKGANGWATWDCERVRSTVAEKIPVESQPDGDSVLSLPVKECGDYMLTIDDLDSDASYAMQFYLGDGGDSGVRAPLARPTAVSVAPDKAFYRVGETPRLMVKSPFAGNALVTVMRDSLVWRKVVALTNATCEVALPPAVASWAPSVDVEVSVVQAVSPDDGRFAVRAHGETVVAVRPAEREIAVAVDAKVEIGDSGTQVDVDIEAGGAGANSPMTAIVTLVDEGINILTDERRPDPSGYFAQSRTAHHPLFDLYHRLLPVLGADALKANGVKTGGGFGAEMLSRVSPVPTRRFKPLAMWQAEVPLEPRDGAARGAPYAAKAHFKLPEFVGEIRVTAVVYGKSAAGSACTVKKVTPKIVAQPDAPRFAAPGDEFDVTLPLANRSGADASVGYALAVSGPLQFAGAENGGVVSLANDGTKVLTFRVKATGIGEGELKFSVSGAGEIHEKSIFLPIRPAVAWSERAGVDVLAPGQSRLYAAIPGDGTARASFSVGSSRLAELGAALEWLAEYPHGCLEQTASRIFPLITAGGILNTIGSAAAENRKEYVVAGVRRVESMLRYSDFVMWPDCNYAPWNREVSLYAAHFLIEAEKSGVVLNTAAKPQLLRLLKRWARSQDAAVSAYACHTLALAGEPEKDRMFRLYDKRQSLDPLSRSRLARAFMFIDDRVRARELLNLCGAPASIKEAAFSLLSLLEFDPEDPRIPSLAMHLMRGRDKSKFSWGTTDTNAHALMALGEYYRRMGMGKSKNAAPNVTRLDNADGSVRFSNSGDAEAFISWKRLELPRVEDVTPQKGALEITRRILDDKGDPADLARLSRGDLLHIELVLQSGEDRTYDDLVIEDLFPAAFEPVLGVDAEDNDDEIATLREAIGSAEKELAPSVWLMRSDARDDRMLVFSKRFDMAAGDRAVFRYDVRVVSAGDFILPAASVEAMYAPELRANTAPVRIHVAE